MQCDLERGSFEPYSEVLKVVPVDITANLVEDVASCLSGGAGPAAHMPST
jgi:hypothetical protein